MRTYEAHWVHLKKHKKLTVVVSGAPKDATSAELKPFAAKLRRALSKEKQLDADFLAECPNSTIEYSKCDASKNQLIFELTVYNLTGDDL